MKPSNRLKAATYAHGLVLRLSYADGAVKTVDFGPWLNAPERTPYEKRYRNTAWFKRFKLLDDHAIMWGDYLIVFASDKLRTGQSFAAPVRRAA